MTARTRKTTPDSDVPEGTAPLARCNAPDCGAHPELRGLCPAHWQTHRGLADPKEGKSGD